MFGSHLRRVFVVCALVAALSLLPVTAAEAFGPEHGIDRGIEQPVEAPRVERESSWGNAFAWIWERLSSLWSKEGAQVDPNG